MTPNTRKKQPAERMQGSGTNLAVRWSRDMLIALQNDPEVSPWLKQAIRKLAQRGPLDALYDAELLCALMRHRWEVSAGLKDAAHIEADSAEVEDNG